MPNGGLLVTAIELRSTMLACTGRGTGTIALARLLERHMVSHVLALRIALTQVVARILNMLTQPA